MNENYLWDRSGEPDPEVQNLEEILGTLRYQPRPLEIPNDMRLKVNRPFFTKLAIAAAIGLIAIASGLWVNLNRPRTLPAVAEKHDSQIDQKRNAPQPEIAPNDNTPQLAVAKDPTPTIIQKRHREPARTFVAQNKSRDTVIRPPTLTPQELAEKEQVLLALRLVSAKLNLAQRKSQGLPQLNIIRNQHKIG
jgi:hypothetical protein